jgi:Uma2 family endonuclease
MTEATTLTLSPEELYETLGEDVKAELINGEVIIMAPASRKHNRLKQFVTRLLAAFVEDRHLGEFFTDQMEMRLGKQRYVPDGSFVSAAHSARVHETYIDGPADLVIEILSEESANRDWGLKMQDYERHGVREYWLINPLVEQMHVYTLGPEGRYVQVMPDAEDAVASTVLPGLRIRAAWLWPGPDRRPDVNAALAANGLS